MSEKQPSALRGYVPPIWVGMAVGVLLALVVWVRWIGPSFDHAIVNILTLIFGFFAVMILLFWFSFFSRYPSSLRMTTLALVVGSVALMVGLLRIDNVSGELVPELSWRWLPRPDQLLDRPAVEQADEAVDLTTTTAADFPQFLGPDRNLRLENLRLATDWKSQPPVKLWRQPIGAGWSAFAAVNGFAVTLEQRGGDELVTCYEISSGELRWSHGIKARHATLMGGVGPRSTPTIDEGKVYALGATGVLRCLDGATGALVWSDDLLKRYQVSQEDDLSMIAWGRAASPLIVDDLVVVPGGGPEGGPWVSLVAFNKSTGEVVWQGGDQQISYSSPALGTFDDERQIIIVNESSVSGHDPATGEQLWDSPWEGSSNTNASTSQAVPLPEDRVFVSKGYGGGSALLRVRRDSESGWNAEEIWSEPANLKTKFTNVVVQDGYVYGLSDGILECVALETGKRAWKRGRYGHGQILGVDDLLLVQAESGEVSLVEATPETHRELGTFPAIDGKTWNNLCLYGPRLLVRNAEEAACYELPVQSE